MSNRSDLQNLLQEAIADIDRQQLSDDVEILVKMKAGTARDLLKELQQ
jgi:hypothetical protein